MPEFAFPAFDHWQILVRKILEKLAWPDDERPKAQARTNYNDARMMVAEPLGLPAHRDYYREERAALVIANFLRAPKELCAGGAAFLWAMAISEHTLTRVTGLQIADALWKLRDEIGLDEAGKRPLELLASTVGNKTTDLMMTEDGAKDVAAAANLTENCVKVVRGWLKEKGMDGERSLSQWLATTA